MKKNTLTGAIILLLVLISCNKKIEVEQPIIRFENIIHKYDDDEIISRVTPDTTCTMKNGTHTGSVLDLNKKTTNSKHNL